MDFNTAQAVVESMRPKQWPKNLLLFAGLVFSQHVYDVTLASRVSVAFFLFCLLSGGTYLVNDILDKESDARNPLKNRRPLASGRLNIRVALISAIILLALSISASFLLDVSFGCITSAYLVTQLLYSLWLKQVVILDVFTIVFGYFLRVVAGTMLVGVEISPWLLACTFLLALFLVICKRRHELVYLGDTACSYRQTLGEYNTALLDQMVSIVTSSTIISYCLYTMSDKTIMQTGTRNLKFTIPFVIYGIFRYLYLVYQKTEGSYPEELLLKDKPLFINVVLWVGLVAVFLYA